MLKTEPHFEHELFRNSDLMFFVEVKEKLWSHSYWYLPSWASLTGQVVLNPLCYKSRIHFSE